VNQGIKRLLIKYGVCFSIASLIAVLVFWSKGFFDHSAAVNVQILADGFSIAGMLFLFVAGMMFISSEGALIGIGYAMRSVVEFFVPMGRKHHMKYADYREQKLAGKKDADDHCFLVIGLIFFLTGILFTIIWYSKYYNIT
jgi:hypothetical protein